MGGQASFTPTKISNIFAKFLSFNCENENFDFLKQFNYNS